MSEHNSHATEPQEQHVGSMASYLAVFGALMVLTTLTVVASRIDLGWANVWIAVLIACCKATIVVLFFMHVKYSSPLVKLTAACGFIWLIFMFVITFADYYGRTLLDPPKGWVTPPGVTVAAAPATAVPAKE